MLAYTALRLAAVEALIGRTIAGDRVYDSRQFALDSVDPEGLDDGPSLCVYTEEGRGEPYGSGRIHPSDTTVWLVVEAVVLVRGDYPVLDPTTGETVEVSAVGVAVTDRAHEATLDTLVSQVRRRLSVDDDVDLDAAADLFRTTNKGAVGAEDVPQRGADKAVKMAGRTLRYHFRISCDRWPAVLPDPSTAFDRLPDPLRSVAARLTLPSALAVVAEIAGRCWGPSAPTAAGPLEVVVTAGLDRDPTTNPDAVVHAP